MEALGEDFGRSGDGQLVWKKGTTPAKAGDAAAAGRARGTPLRRIKEGLEELEGLEGLRPGFTHARPGGAADISSALRASSRHRAETWKFRFKIEM